MPITGATQLAGVIGWPVEHSRSPAIHNAAAAAVGVDLVYTALPVRPGRGADAANAMRTLGIRGLSVTMPHKGDVMAAVDELTPVAQALGAVNHITNTDGHLVGNNTDGAGFVLGLRHDAGVELDGKTVGVFGSGGAARSIVHSCASAGAEVIVVARDDERARNAAAVGGQDSRVGTIEDFVGANVVVNATPIGMAGSAFEAQTPFDIEAVSDDAVVVDIVYNPLVTPLLVASRSRRLTVVDGLSMLVGQAAAQFQHWTGIDAPIDVMREAARTGTFSRNDQHKAHD